MSFSKICSKELKRDDINRWFAFCFIALAVLVSYFPSLYFPPRADQVIYLSETANIQHPWDLIIGCYDHNRHRTIAPGDELLFRPLLYVFLGSEQVFWGHHFWVWQLSGILTHLILIWVLLRLLWHLSNPWLAFGGTWVFALSIFNYEMVTWPHLTSYILMMAFIVAAVEQVVFCFEDNQVPWGRIMRLLVYFFIACFIYETANIFVLIITGMLALSFPSKKWRLLLLITPVLLYAFFSYINFTYVNHITHLIAGVPHGILIWKYIESDIYLTSWWLYEGLFNGLYHYLLAMRTMFIPNEVGVFKPLVLDDPQVVLELIMVMVFLGLAWIERRQFFKRAKLLIILSGMLFSYVMVIVVGRYQEMGSIFATVGVNTYFSYIFWVIIVIAAFVLVRFKEKGTQLQQGLIVAFVTASFLLGLLQGKKIYDMTLRYSNDTNKTVLLITTLDLLVQVKKYEPDFSFYVDPKYVGNMAYPAIIKLTDPPNRVYSIAELLYPQYFRPRALAKYKFLIKNE